MLELEEEARASRRFVQFVNANNINCCISLGEFEIYPPLSWSICRWLPRRNTWCGANLSIDLMKNRNFVWLAKIPRMDWSWPKQLRGQRRKSNRSTTRKRCWLILHLPSKLIKMNKKIFPLRINELVPWPNTNVDKRILWRVLNLQQRLQLVP